MVRAERTADQARGPGAGPKFADALDGRLLERGFIGQAQIIIGRKIEKSLAVNGEARRLGRINAPQFAKQILLAKGAQTGNQCFIERAHLQQMTYRGKVGECSISMNINSL